VNNRSLHLRDMTDVAVELTERELSRRGATILKGDSRELSLSVQSAKLDIGFVVSTATVIMEANPHFSQV